MKKRKTSISIIFALVLSLIVGTTICNATFSYGSNDAEEKTYRIGYIESEPYSSFAVQLYGMAEHLEKEAVLNGFAGNMEENSEELWDEISNTSNLSNVEFVQDAYYSMDGSSEKEIFERDDIDLYIAMGTVAGSFLSKADEEGFDYMVFASADPIGSNIVGEGGKQLTSNSFAHIDATRFQREIYGAYEILDFKKIGVVYQDSEAAYSYSGIGPLTVASKELGFEIVELHVDEPTNPNEYEKYYDDLLRAYEELIPQIDALYITTASIEDEMIPKLVKDVHKANIPTIAQSSESQVEAGCFLNISTSDSIDEGYFSASVLIEYIDGIPLSEINMFYESAPKISMNYTEGLKIGIEMPMEILLTVDNLYITEKLE